MKSTIEGIATLTGTIIGAGVLGIPYVIAKAGFLTGLITLIGLGIIVLFMYLYLGEIVLRTKGNHQLTGYAEIYLGKWGKYVMGLTMVIGIYGAMVAYLIGSSESLAQLFNGSGVLWLIPYFLLISIIIYFGLKWVKKFEVVLGSFLLFVVFIIIFSTIKHVEISNLSHFNIKNLFLPYGVILFAYLGMPAIPEIREEMRNNLKGMKKAIIIGTLIPIAVYFLFALAIVGSVSLQDFNLLEPNERIATIALASVIGKKVFILGNLFALLSMSTSFLALALALKEMFIFDYKLNHAIALFITLIVPLILTLSGFTNFIQALAVTGIIVGGIDGILLVLMSIRAKKMGKRKPEYSIPINLPIAIFLILVFVAGTLFYFML